MIVAVVLKGGTEKLVSKDELQFLLATMRITSFERSDGWAQVDRDPLRKRSIPYPGQDRRQRSLFAKDIWY